MTDRGVEERLARLHLRTGALALARAELEALAGRAALDERGPLDPDALLDLAEIRWRTGDLAGAGEAASAYLEAGGEEALGYVIAAEAMSGLGRPGEARRLVGHALERIDVPLDVLFAGMSRSGVWPMNPTDPGEPVAPLFPPAGQSRAPARVPSRARPARAVVSGRAPAGGTSAAEREPTDRGRGPDEAGRAQDVPLPDPALPGGDGGRPATTDRDIQPAGVTSAAQVGGPGLWDVADAAGRLPERVDPLQELAAARAALARGRNEDAAVRLAVVLRVAPSLAPAILDAAAEGRGAAFDLVRGDAYRLVGHEIEARRAYAAAATAVHEAASDASAAEGGPQGSEEPPGRNDGDGPDDSSGK